VYASDAGSRYSYFELPKPWMSAIKGSGRGASADGSVTVVSSGTLSQLFTTPLH